MNNIIKTTLLLLLPFSFVWAQEVPNTLTPEQKAYELSMVWKELSYNFANMDHCQGLNMDSLYAAYIPKIQRTKDDFEHYLTMQEFVAHFHNSHTYCMMPQQLFPSLAMIRLQTECRDGRAYSPITPYLVDKDSIMLSGVLLPRVNNSAYRAWAAARMLYGNPESVDEYTKQVYCPHLFNNAFDTIQSTTVANGNPDSQRYHGKVFVWVGPRTASAAEGFVMQLVQSPNVCVVGKTTAGATGQPLVVPLPSGIICMINSFRSFDTRNRDCSNGIVPDVERDFGNSGVEEVVKMVIK